MFYAPLKKARGLGSAKDGTEHFIVQRITAVALVPLVIWFVWGIATHLDGEYATAVQWIGQPFNAVMLIALVAAGFWHSALGVQVVVEDYVADEFWKITALLLSKLLHALLAIAAVVSILKICFGA